MVTLGARRGELDYGAASGGARHPPDYGRRMEAAGRGALGPDVLRRGGGAGGGPARPQDREKSQWPASCPRAPPQAGRQLADEQAGGEMLGIGGGMRRQRRVDDRQGIVGWAALKG